MRVFFLLSMFFLFACGSESNNPGFTKVILGKTSDKAILDGGIVVGAANIEGVIGSHAEILADENDIAVMEIPNGSYRFGGIGYTANTTSGNKISQNIRCAGANNGAVYNLNGQTIELTLDFSETACTNTLFAKSTERDPAANSTIPKVRFAMCSGALPTAAGAGCTGPGLTGGIVYLLNYVNGETTENIQSQTIAIGNGTVISTGTNKEMRIPVGNGIPVPVMIVTPGPKYYIFGKGLSQGTFSTDGQTSNGVSFYNATTDIVEVYLQQ
ncbi:MAG: hypothetical protein GY909_03565 [Oligoflexia bacterium]|nr:hypothetical protein [Oligoflexia bacterium]